MENGEAAFDRFVADTGLDLDQDTYLKSLKARTNGKYPLMKRHLESEEDVVFAHWVQYLKTARNIFPEPYERANLAEYGNSLRKVSRRLEALSAVDFDETRMNIWKQPELVMKVAERHAPLLCPHVQTEEAFTKTLGDLQSFFKTLADLQEKRRRNIADTVDGRHGHPENLYTDLLIFSLLSVRKGAAASKTPRWKLLGKHPFNSARPKANYSLSQWAEDEEVPPTWEIHSMEGNSVRRFSWEVFDLTVLRGRRKQVAKSYLTAREVTLFLRGVGVEFRLYDSGQEGERPYEIEDIYNAIERARSSTYPPRIWISLRKYESKPPSPSKENLHLAQVLPQKK